MIREYVDFHLVSSGHEEIHARLQNWARWQHNRAGGTVTPMFRMYRSTDVHQETPGSDPVDAMDAQRVQKGVTMLPGKHRLAVSWNYVKRNNPRKAAQSVGESLEGLALLVRQARTMLINRRV